MQNLKDKLREITCHIPRDKPVVYLDYPIHLNFGDILIMRGTERFLADYGYNVIGRSSSTNMTSRLFSSISPDVTIVFHGGGNFGDLYPVHQKFREKVIRSFPRNKIVILPQTVHFNSKDEAAASAKIFSSHADLKLFVRDQPSLDATSGVFTPNVFLSPDMAHQLWTPAVSAFHTHKNLPTLYFLRKDIEAIASQGELDNKPLKTYDWMDFTPIWQRRVYGLILRAHCAEAMIGHQFGACRIWYEYCDRLHAHMASIFGGFGDVTTSRLHGLIFSLLLGKRVRYLDNSYGKLGHYANAWLKEMQAVTPYTGLPDACGVK